MHLIKTADDMIYDLENGRLYVNNWESLDMYDTPTSVGLQISESLEDVDNTWAYLLTLCRNRIAANPDATKAQDAPQLKEDGKARVKWTDEEDHEDAPWLTAGMIGTVIEIIPGTRVLEMAFEGHREQVALLIDQVEPVN